ncbi:CDGSH iron-sulfur domain-containing protein [uncultured Alistipes sp.]|uniref:CDGSH iron-sulfur domain-containing protein n=1 Tax=uncultured Alistipes sp. TaxID=538949 RepID=UPI00272FC637|nr:CDGSH iron-sulfur domain-containing protein [uncultured Alistipes sp.]
MSAHKTPTDSDPAAGRVSVTVTEKGPYLVYGRPPFCEQFIMPDPDNESWYFQEGRHFSTEAEPTALCRCGASQRKPYCDGAHIRADWDPQLTASRRPLLDGADKTEGATLTMTDNPQYCVFARFCHPFGGAWTLTELSSDPEARRLAVREASMCPSARLTAWDKASGTPYEFRFEPSLGLIEDPAVGASGGLWIRGGIPMRRENGEFFELRNRVVVCRCGQSANKPYCDGTHAAVKWRDGLQGDPVGETLPEEVY